MQIVYADRVFFIYALLTPHIRKVEGENEKKRLHSIHIQCCTNSVCNVARLLGRDNMIKGEIRSFE